MDTEKELRETLRNCRQWDLSLPTPLVEEIDRVLALPPSSEKTGELREAYNWCANEARRYAAQYFRGSDTRNTFIILAESIEKRAIAAIAQPTGAETEEGSWWCEGCQATKSPQQVTFTENCTVCGRGVVWMPETEPSGLSQTVTWIPVSERLPEDGDIHEVSCSDGITRFAQYNHHLGEWLEPGTAYDAEEEITHWAEPLKSAAELARKKGAQV